MGNKQVDVIIIGAGPGGLAAAYQLASTKSVLVIENDLWGGTCPNRGCDPKKMLYSVVHTKQQTTDLAAVGLTSDSKIDWESLIAFKTRYTEKVPSGTLAGLKSTNILTEHGQAKFIDQNTVEVNETIYQADKIILATGLHPVIPQMPGCEFIHTSTDFLSMPHLPKKIAFLGGGFVGIELANIAAESGSEVHLIQHNDRILKAYPADLTKKLITSMTNHGVNFHFDTEISGIQEKADGNYELIGNDDFSLEVDEVFTSMGRQPQLDSLNLEVTGITFDNRGIQVNAFMETANPNIYAIGDVATKPVPKLTPVASFEGSYVAKRILNSTNEPINYPAIPQVVYSSLQLATTGVSLSDAQENPDMYLVKTAQTGEWYTFNRIQDHDAVVITILDKKTAPSSARQYCRR
ncbi:dihydrolipoyl dehydrogenase family protein [Lentilactobacillus kosonis]|uniref:Glutathione reductase n=1 Tax=Lentilactobacillus kosonis TaxID=2810561 RepID=A0A401FMM4_9LACO|nr:NAD(P)/FAD-dependent oxidoreductase [Lentilactobacillus kosonis]GAY73587.1 glutathione reductase [Lentilactobacillus kosonis]